MMISTVILRSSQNMKLKETFLLELGKLKVANFDSVVAAIGCTPVQLAATFEYL